MSQLGHKKIKRAFRNLEESNKVIEEIVERANNFVDLDPKRKNYKDKIQTDLDSVYLKDDILHFHFHYGYCDGLFNHKPVKIHSEDFEKMTMPDFNFYVNYQKEMEIKDKERDERKEREERERKQYEELKKKFENT